MPFETAMPMTIRIPISAVIEKPCPAAISASDDADQRDRDGEEHDERQAQRLELRGHDHEDHHHRQPERQAQAGEGGAHQLDLADELELDVRACAGRRASARSRSAATLPMSRPSVCMSTCAARCELVALDGDRARPSGGSSP